MYLRAKEVHHQLQLLIKLSMKEAYLLHIFLNTIITHSNVNGVMLDHE